MVLRVWKFVQTSPLLLLCIAPNEFGFVNPSQIVSIVSLGREYAFGNASVVLHHLLRTNT